MYNLELTLILTSLHIYDTQTYNVLIYIDNENIVELARIENKMIVVKR